MYENKKKWKGFLWSLFAVYGLLCFVSFVFDKSNYKYYIYVYNSSEPEIVLVIRKPFSFSKTTHPLKFNDGRWQYQQIKDFEKHKDGGVTITYGKWVTVPEVKGIIDPDEIDYSYLDDQN